MNGFVKRCGFFQMTTTHQEMKPLESTAEPFEGNKRNYSATKKLALKPEANAFLITLQPLKPLTTMRHVEKKT